MYTPTPIRVSDYVKRFYTLDINASWITIRSERTGVVLFKREPTQDNWYDERHRAIVDALSALDAAVFAAVEGDRK